MLLLLISNFYAFLTFYFGGAVWFPDLYVDACVFLWHNIEVCSAVNICWPSFWLLLLICLQISVTTSSDNTLLMTIHSENQQENDKMRPDYIPEFFYFCFDCQQTGRYCSENKNNNILKTTKTTTNRIMKQAIIFCRIYVNKRFPQLSYHDFNSLNSHWHRSIMLCRKYNKT